MPAFQGLAPNGSVLFAQEQVGHPAHSIGPRAIGLLALGALLPLCADDQSCTSTAARLCYRPYEGAVCLQVVEHVDVVVYATGYVYSFPFLNEANVVAVKDNWCLLPQHALAALHVIGAALVSSHWQCRPLVDALLLRCNAEACSADPAQKPLLRKRRWLFPTGWRRCMSTCGHRASRPASASSGCPGRCCREYAGCHAHISICLTCSLTWLCSIQVWQAEGCDMASLE